MASTLSLLRASLAQPRALSLPELIAQVVPQPEVGLCPARLVCLAALVALGIQIVLF